MDPSMLFVSRASIVLFTGLSLAPVGCAATGSASEETVAAVFAPLEEHSRANVIVEPDQADHLWVFAESERELGSGGEFHIYLDAATHPEARASFAKFGLGAGAALPAHRHDRTEEITYFLSGEGVVQVFDDGAVREIPVRAGYVWYVPPGAWHGLRNTGEVPLRLVFATIPNEEDGLLSFFRRIGTKPGEKSTPLSPEEFARIAAEHDLILRPASVE